MAKRAKSLEVTADASLKQAKKTSPLFKKLLTKGHGGHGHGGVSVREVHHKGRHIVIKTSYQITVDGKKFDAPLGVSNGGQVSYHGMPNVGFDSAIDLMKSVIDQFPDAFPKKAKPGKPGDGHGGHHPARRNTRRRIMARASG